ncbi:MAG: amidohydrolase family protein [Bryobacteraceae bacterium]
MQRRTFLKASVAAPIAQRLWGQSDLMWGGPVLDTHLHLRSDPDACFTHMKGCGVTNAVLLTRDVDEDKAKQEVAKRPGVFVRSVALDPARPGAVEGIRAAIAGGAVSIGELKHHLALDSAEMRRVFEIAAELKVPVMMHIQTFPHFPGELPYNSGYDQFDKILRAYPKTNFIGHGDLFWANIAADVPTDRGYPAGPIKTGGRTDRWLSEFPNFYGDISANSGNNALSRDPDFTKGFLTRHQDKLIFGSDCSCADGNGAGVSQNNNPEASRLAGKCVARETLTLAKRSASPDVFRKITWENGIRVFRIQGMAGIAR